MDVVPAMFELMYLLVLFILSSFYDERDIEHRLCTGRLIFPFFWGGGPVGGVFGIQDSSKVDLHGCIHL